LKRQEEAMAEFFKAAEVVAAAVEIEKRGQAFYRRLAQAAQSDEVKRFFEYFAAEEARHESVFRGLARQVSPVELPAWSTQDEYADYLRALLDSHTLFTPGLAESLDDRGGDLAWALHLAMSFEKDSLLFFMEMISLVPQEQRVHVQRCIEEERLHMRQLGEMLQHA